MGGGGCHCRSSSRLVPSARAASSHRNIMEFPKIHKHPILFGTPVTTIDCHSTKHIVRDYCMSQGCYVARVLFVESDVFLLNLQGYLLNLLSQFHWMSNTKQITFQPQTLKNPGFENFRLNELRQSFTTIHHVSKNLWNFPEVCLVFPPTIPGFCWNSMDFRHV